MKESRQPLPSQIPLWASLLLAFSLALFLVEIRRLPQSTQLGRNPQLVIRTAEGAPVLGERTVSPTAASSSSPKGLASLVRVQARVERGSGACQV